MDFYKSINYSLGNEDWSVEAQALQVKPEDRVVCVTASGDRPLHLLMTGCQEVVSIDMNVAQNHLLSLKIAAIESLEFDTYLAFLGADPSPHRLKLYAQVRQLLNPETQKFWDKHKRMIQRGLMFQGKVEKLTKLTALFFKSFRYKKINKLFSFDNLEEQQAFVAKEWDTATMRNLFKWILNPKFSKLFSNDPGLNGYVDSAENPGLYIYDKMIACLHSTLAKHSALLQLMFTGTVTRDAFFPYLTYEGYQAIRPHTKNLTLKTTNIIEYLANHQASSFDGFSMSDIASYMPQAVFEKLLASIYHAAKPGARFCIREFVATRTIPTQLSQQFKRDIALEAKLEKEESNFVYRFKTGTIQKQ